MKYYYGFEYASGKRTTTGQPHPLTGRLSIAGNLVVFTNKANRNEWVLNGEITSDMQGNCRESVNQAHVRDLMLGDSINEMNEYIANIVDLLVD